MFSGKRIARYAGMEFDEFMNRVLYNGMDDVDSRIENGSSACESDNDETAEGSEK